MKNDIAKLNNDAIPGASISESDSSAISSSNRIISDKEHESLLSLAKIFVTINAREKIIDKTSFDKEAF